MIPATAKSPTKTGMIPWKLMSSGTMVRFRMMKPRKAERAKVVIPEMRLAHAHLNRSQVVLPSPVPLGHSLISM